MALFLVKLRWKHSTQLFNHNSTTSVLYPQNNLQSEHFVNQILYIFENELSFIVRHDNILSITSSNKKGFYVWYI